MKSKQLVDEALKSLDLIKKRKVQKKNDMALSEIISLTKDDIKKLDYKKYETLKEKDSIISKLFIYYKEYEHFRNYCKSMGLGSYFEKHYCEDKKWF